MVKAVSENEFLKKVQSGEQNDFDMSKIVESQRKNLESLKAMNERAAEGLGKLAEKQSALMSDALKGLKDYAEKAGDKAEDGFEAKFEEAQTVFKKTIDSFGDIAESAKNTGEDLWDMVQKRMEEGLKELEEFSKKFKE